MFKGLTAIASLAVILTVASPVLAQSPGWVKVGGLNCTMSPTIGLLVVEEQAVNCRFTPDGYYPSEHYIGTIGTVGYCRRRRRRRHAGVGRIHAYPGAVTRFARRRLRRS